MNFTCDYKLKLWNCTIFSTKCFDVTQNTPYPNLEERFSDVISPSFCDCHYDLLKPSSEVTYTLGRKKRILMATQKGPFPVKICFELFASNFVRPSVQKTFITMNTTKIMHKCEEDCEFFIDLDYDYDRKLWVSDTEPVNVTWMSLLYVSFGCKVDNAHFQPLTMNILAICYVTRLGEFQSRPTIKFSS